MPVKKRQKLDGGKKGLVMSAEERALALLNNDDF
jgi:hypothetical protein